MRPRLGSPPDGPHRPGPTAAAPARGVRLRRAGGHGARRRRPRRRAARPAPDRRGRDLPARRGGAQPAAQARARAPRRADPAADRPGLHRMGGALQRRCAWRAPVHRPARRPRAQAPARAETGRDRPGAGPRHARARQGAGGGRRRADRARRARGQGRRLLRRGQGPDRRGLSSRAVRGRRSRVPRAGPRPTSLAAEPEPGGGRRRVEGPDRQGRLPGGAAGRRDRLGQDRGLSGGRGGAAAGGARLASAGAVARDRPDPGGAGALRGPFRRHARRMAFGRRAARPPAGVGCAAGRPLPHRGGRALGPVPAVPQAAADRGR